MGTTAFLFAIFLSAFSPPPSGAAEQSAALPPAIAAVQQFRGRVEYVAHRSGDASGALVHGALSLAESGWSLDENSGDMLLHAGSGGNFYRAGTTTLVFDDPLTADPLANVWVAALPLIAGDRWRPADESQRTWVGGNSKILFFLDAPGGNVASMTLGYDSQSVSYMFGAWTSAAGLTLPQQIVRLRDDREDGTVFVDRYEVARWATADPRAGAWLGHAYSAPVDEGSTAGLHPMAKVSGRRARLQFLIAIGLLALGLLACAWLRRDALLAGWGARIMADPRRWRDAGTSIFVSSDGLLYFDGCRYRVGAEFYERAALVQTSPLFLRVSAPRTSRVVVLARKFRAPGSNRRAASFGFSLVEALVATALFTLVIVGAVYPALIVVARADLSSHERAEAVRVAANVLADQQAALAYSASSSFPQVAPSTQYVDGLRVTVARAASLTGLNAVDIIVTVSGSSGQELARLVTIAGPPAPTPAPAGTY